MYRQWFRLKVGDSPITREGLVEGATLLPFMDECLRGPISAAQVWTR